ncbi:DNA polymerase III subunit gamma and tau [Arthrobacter sp. TMS1-12-1]
MSTALYRRYRPETFADVIGQEHVTEPLMAAIDKDRINHAYLFSGPRGCGKTTSARILARCLNCAQGPTSTPCGVCDSCVELARNGSGSLDVIEIDAASHGGVDDARDLRERATFAPVRDRFKIFIIDEAHMVTSAGFNALLKIVEEPPEHILFIFATTEPDKVIGTIRSRTHHYPFRLVPPEPLMAYLDLLCRQENVPVAPGVLSLVVRAGGGSVRDSLSVLDQLMAGAGAAGLDYELAVSLLGYTHATLLDDVVDSVAAGDAATVFNAVDRVIQTGHDPRRFVEDLLERFRDLIVINAVPEGAASILRGVPDDQLNRMRTQANQLGAGELSRAADVTNAALNEMTGATSPRLHLELLCARLLLPAADASVRGTLARVDRIERRLEYAAGTPAADGGSEPIAGPGSVAAAEPSKPPRPRLDGVPRTAEEAAARWSLPTADPAGPAVPAALTGPQSPAVPAVGRDQQHPKAPAADSSPDWGGNWGVSTDSAFADPVPAASTPARPAASTPGPAGAPTASGTPTDAGAPEAPGTAGTPDAPDSPGVGTAEGTPLGAPAPAAPDGAPDGAPAQGGPEGGPDGAEHAASAERRADGQPGTTEVSREAPGASADGSAQHPGERARQPHGQQPQQAQAQHRAESRAEAGAGSGRQAGPQPGADPQRQPDTAPNRQPAPQQHAPQQPAPQQPAPQQPAPQQPAPQQPAPAAGGPVQPQQESRRPEAGRQGQSAASGGNVEMIRRAWPEIMDEVAHIKRATWLIVNVSAKPRSFEGNQLVLAFVNQGNAIGFQRGPHMDNLKQAIYKVLGLTCSIEAVHDAGGSGESGPKVPAGTAAPGSTPGPASSVSGPSGQPLRPGEDTRPPAGAEVARSAEPEGRPSAGVPAPSSPAAPTPSSRAGAAPRPAEPTDSVAPADAAAASSPGPRMDDTRTPDRAVTAGTSGVVGNAVRPEADSAPASEPAGPASDTRPTPPRDADRPSTTTPAAAPARGGNAPAAPGSRSAARDTSTSDRAKTPAPASGASRGTRSASSDAEAVSAWDPSMADDSWALVEPPEEAFDPGPGWGSVPEDPYARQAAGPSGTGGAQPPTARVPDTASSPGPDAQRTGQGAGRGPSTPDPRPGFETAPAGSAPAPTASRSVVWSPPGTATPAPAPGDRSEAPASGAATTDAGAAHQDAAHQDAARATARRRGPVVPRFAAPAPVAAGTPAPAPDPGATAPGPAATDGGAGQDRPAAADTARRKPVSRYQQLLDEAERKRAEEAAAARGAVDLRFVEDEPSADDETIEESGLVGRTAIERILNGRLVEERSVDGQ